MKKVFFLMIIGLCFWAGQLQAQKASFGIKAGLNVADIHSNELNSLDAKASAYGGALVHIHLNKNFAVQPELMYSGQGARSTNGDVQYTARLNYVNLPVLLQYMINDGFRLETGPQLGILASARLKSGGVLTNIKSDYTTADFGWTFGAGYLFHSGLGIDARYNLGITDINNTGSREKLYNRVFQLGLFYQFRE